MALQWTILPNYNDAETETPSGPIRNPDTSASEPSFISTETGKWVPLKFSQALARFERQSYTEISFSYKACLYGAGNFPEIEKKAQFFQEIRITRTYD